MNRFSDPMHVFLCIFSRIVNTCLATELKEIHAFEQKTLTPEQWEKQKQQWRRHIHCISRTNVLTFIFNKKINGKKKQNKMASLEHIHPFFINMSYNAILVTRNKCFICGQQMRIEQMWWCDFYFHFSLFGLWGTILSIYHLWYI